MVEAEEAFPEGDVRPQNVFQVDEGLTPLQAMAEWVAEGNPPGQRVAHILSMPAAAAESSLEEARNILLPLLSQLAFDEHPDVKQATAEVLGPLGPILAARDPQAAAEAGGSADAMDLLVLAHRLLQDAERGVQEAAATSVAQFASLLSAEHRNEHLSAVVDGLMHNYDDEQMQECAVDLLAKVVAAAGPACPGWCQEHALPRLLKLALHRDYGIRIQSVTALVQLAACLPEDQRAGSLLACFADLAGDQVWSVRQECAAELATLAARLPRQAVRERLLPLWGMLVGDVSAWVQAAAKRQAGPLLASLHPDDCSPELLDCFVALASGPATLNEACAHFLPAVLHNLGAQRWPQLRQVVPALAGSEYISVRVALAESMHRLAALLGREAVAEDLLPVIESLSRDEHPAVCDALAANIQALLAALPPASRLGQLAFLARMHADSSTSCGHWRMRLLLAEQLAGIAALLGQQGLTEVLLPATLRLCEDPVAAVREAAAHQLGGMVRQLLAQANNVQGSPSERQAEEAEGEGEEGGQPSGEQGCGAPAAAAQQQQQQPEAGQEGAERDGAPAVQPPADTQEAQQGREPAAAGQRAAGVRAELEPGGGCVRLQDPTAVVQQIVQHMVELQRSACHRRRQTYLAFCGALLLPPAAPPVQQGASQDAAAAQQAVAELAQNGRTSHPTATPAEPAAAASAAGDAAASSSRWPKLPEAVASSGVVAGLLEGVVALQADPVPNVRLGLARLLAALAVQQPQLLQANPQAAAALASLAADADRDVAQAAAAATGTGTSTP